MNPKDAARIANPTIAEVFREFLAEQRRTLSPRTCGRYEEVLDLFTGSLDGYAYECLNKADGALFDRLYSAEGEGHREFCEVFGPEHIARNVDEFLGYFMVRKVMAGKDLLRSAGTVTKKLGKWLANQGYADASESAEMRDRGATAARNLPAALDLARLLEEFAEGGPEEEEGHFTFTRVENEKIWVRDFAGREYGPIRLPEEVTKACTPGWTFSGCLGRSGKDWHIADVWNVYPR